jgi:putative ABC transport system substrate-binding protein
MEDAAASTLKVKSVMALVHDDDEIEAAFASLAREPGAGAVLLPDIFTVAHHQRVIALAEGYRVPTVYSYRFMVERGGLISYGVDIGNLFERAGHLRRSHSQRRQACRLAGAGANQV